jgi:amidase
MGSPRGGTCTVAATAGYPTGSLPLGYTKYNGRPFGIVVIAPRNREDLVVKVMSAWGATIPARKPPP